MIDHKYVVSLFKKHNLKPTACHLMLSDEVPSYDSLADITHCCGIGAIMYDQRLPPNKRLALKISSDDQFAFMSGFDYVIVKNKSSNLKNNSSDLKQHVLLQDGDKLQGCLTALALINIPLYEEVCDELHKRNSRLCPC